MIVGLAFAVIYTLIDYAYQPAALGQHRRTILPDRIPRTRE
jgi:hypothetical protein